MAAASVVSMDDAKILAVDPPATLAQPETAATEKTAIYVMAELAAHQHPATSAQTTAKSLATQEAVRNRVQKLALTHLNASKLLLLAKNASQTVEQDAKKMFLVKKPAPKLVKLVVNLSLPPLANLRLATQTNQLAIAWQSVCNLATAMTQVANLLALMLARSRIPQTAARVSQVVIDAVNLLTHLVKILASKTAVKRLVANMTYVVKMKKYQKGLLLPLAIQNVLKTAATINSVKKLASPTVNSEPQIAKVNVPKIHKLAIQIAVKLAPTTIILARINASNLVEMTAAEIVTVQDQ